MYKIDTAGSVNGTFVEENPVTGQAPTVVAAEWLNAVQDEITNVIANAGLALDKADSTQLLKALSALSPVAVTLSLTGSQTLAPNVFTRITLTPNVVDNSLFSWSAGFFTVKKTGLYRFSSRLHFAVTQASGNCQLVLQHAYTLGAGNTTAFSPVPSTYENNRLATNYVSPGTSSGGNTVFPIAAEGATRMTVGDKFSLMMVTDSNATMNRNVDNSHVGRQGLLVEFLGGV